MEVNKYNLDFSSEVIESNRKRLVSQIWKLIPMRENNENWESQLQSVIIEIIGLSKIFQDNPKFLILLSKLEGMKEAEFMVYRREVFEAINLVHEALMEVEENE